jgi:hypothetical protein
MACRIRISSLNIWSNWHNLGPEGVAALAPGVAACAPAAGGGGALLSLALADVGLGFLAKVDR